MGNSSKGTRKGNDRDIKPGQRKPDGVRDTGKGAGKGKNREVNANNWR